MAQTSSHQIEDRWWNLAIFIMTAFTLGIVLISLYFGNSVLFTHLFYIPIVLVAYHYPDRGIYFASMLGLAYFASDIVLNNPSIFYIAVGAGRVGMMVIVAWVVSYLTDTLQSGEERYRETIDATKDGIFVVDRGLTPVLFNAGFLAWCDKIGVKMPKSPWNTPIFEILPFIPPSLQAQYGWVFASGTPYRTEERFEFGGREVHTEIHMTPIEEDEEVRRVLTVVRDITARKHAEEELRRSNDLYHTIFDTTGSATMIVAEDGTIALVNRECETLFGYTAGELEEGMAFLDLMAKDDRLRLKQYHEMRLAGNDAAVPRTYEAQCIDAKGLSHHTLINIGTIPQTTRTVVSILDITPRKQAERLIAIANAVRYMIVHETGKRNLMHKACRELAKLDPQIIAAIALCEEGVLVPVAISDQRFRAMHALQLSRPWVKEVVESQSVNLEAELVSQNDTGVDFIEYAFALPMLYGATVKGVLVIYLLPKALVGEQELHSLQTLANDLAFAINSMEIEEQKRVALIQIEKNMEQLAILNDHIRNPLQAIVGFVDLEGDGLSETIRPYVAEIDSLINQLDVGWVESEKIRAFLRKHYDIMDIPADGGPD
jgi:PAS domain S-box-containing protein